MGKALTADDVLPIVAVLTPMERVRLVQLIASRHGGDEFVYRAIPPSREEFWADDEQLSWDAEGWEDTC